MYNLDIAHSKRGEEMSKSSQIMAFYNECAEKSKQQMKQNGESFPSSIMEQYPIYLNLFSDIKDQKTRDGLEKEFISQIQDRQKN